MIVETREVDKEAEPEEQGVEPFPPAWKDVPKEVELARNLFDKYKGPSGRLGRQPFEHLILSVVGSGAGSKTKREQRRVAWYTHREESTDSTDFIVFLKILSLCGVSPKLLRIGYESAMKPAAEKDSSALKCPQCGEDLPPSFINKNEDEKLNENLYILKRLEDIDRRRASLRDDAQKSGNGLVLENLDRIERCKAEGGSPRIDPKVVRLRTEEKEEVLKCLDKLVEYGFNEIVDLSLLAGNLRKEREREKSEEVEKEKRKEEFVAKLPSPPTSPAKGGDARGDDSAPVLAPRKRSVEQPPVPARPTPPRALSASAVATASPPRNLARRSSAAPGGGSPRVQRTNSITPTYRRGSSGSGPPTPRGGSGNSLRSSRSFDMNAITPPPPEQLPTPLSVPEGMIKKEDLGPSVQRRTVSLTECVRRGDLKMVKQWTESGAEVNVFVDGKTTLMHLAVECRHKAACDIIKIIASQVNVKVWNEYGETPLHTAARYGYPDKITALIACGADPNILDYRQVTPLHVAVRAANGAPCVSALAEGGADPNAVDPKGCTALFHAVVPDVVVAMVKAGVEVSAQDEDGNNALHALVNNGTFEHDEGHEALGMVAAVNMINMKNKAGDTPLHKLVAKGDSVLSERLALMGGDIDLENGQCESAMKIVQRRWQQEAGNKDQLVWSGQLIGWGMDIDKMSRKGTSWYQKTTFGWDMVPTELQQVATTLHGLAKAEGKTALVSTDASSLPPWALTVRKFIEPDKGEWPTTTASIPPTLHPCKRIQLTLRSEQGDEISTQLRLLPVV
eukprot:TRINITY_DN16472_c0_g1_i1.p1 TRINITY_DN16472_c0_g1~~TRINITY_DN16472_c0_g1_i1.p1  ORF type:complete len:802 (+),score=164.14 TRINITY_DN16472_c0_g1_i1:32-2407(+)